MIVDLPEPHYSADQVNIICYALDRTMRINHKAIRNHAIKTGLAIRVDTTTGAGRLTCLIPESSVPYIIRDLTGREFDQSKVRDAAIESGYQWFEH